MMTRKVLRFLAMGGLLLLPACSSDNTNVAEELNINRIDLTTVGFTANFSPASGVIPFPNNLLYSGTLDGTLNIPVANPGDLSDPKVAMNALDGFSTTAPISTTFNRAIAPSSLTPSTVRVFEVQLSNVGGTMPVGGPVSGVVGQLTYGVDFVATLSSVDTTGKTLVILPLKPLKPRSHYLVALTNGIKDNNDVKAAPDAGYFVLRGKDPVAGSAETVRQLINAQEGALASQGVDLESVVLSWTFSTQSTGNVLGVVRSMVQASSPESVLVNSGVSSPFGAASLYVGTLSVPYYLTAAGSPQETAPLSTWWKALNPAFAGDTEKNLSFLNPLPVPTETLAIPLLASIPKTTKPEEGWPVVIYQHGITTNRATMLAIADSLAQEGFAVVAIDMPLHGLTGNETDGTAPFRQAGKERIFDLDLVDNGTGAPGPDGLVDPSGTHFINLASLLTSRDNLRQAVADLFVLTKALETMDAGGNDFDTKEIYFVGHSLGGMVGSVFLALEPTVNSAVLAMPGGGIAKLLDGSVSFGPKIAAGLGAKGVIKGTADFESFLGAAQTLLDSADPINYAAAATAERGILMFEVVGDGAENLPDQVVPNNVMALAPVGTVPSPLAGTDPLAALMGLTSVSTMTTDSDLALVRFTAGDHGSILSPVASPLVTSVMQNAMATFLATDGGTVSISNETVVK
jgi:dienelactone hydrolase